MQLDVVVRVTTSVRQKTNQETKAIHVKIILLFPWCVPHCSEEMQIEVKHFCDCDLEDPLPRAVLLSHAVGGRRTPEGMVWASDYQDNFTSDSKAALEAALPPALPFS